MTQLLQNDLSNVVAMSFKNVDPMRPRQLVSAYWTSLRDGGDIPSRLKIDPRGLGTALPNAFVLARISPMKSVVRLAGSELSAALGTDATGLPFGTLFTPNARATAATAVGAVLDTPAKAEMTLTAKANYGLITYQAGLTLLPLKGPSGTVDRILGVFVSAHGTPKINLSYEIDTVELTSVFGNPPTRRSDFDRGRPAMRIVPASRPKPLETIQIGTEV